MSVKHWKLPEDCRALSRRIQQEYGLTGFLADLLAGRNLTSVDALSSFLRTEEEEVSIGEALESPFALADMEKAVERIQIAVDNGEKITIYGDYDCDGVTSTTILYTYLSLLGADVGYYIPKREEEGYGMNRHAVERLSREGTQLIITVDNGISALEEIDLANRLGMEVVVTDHHQPGESLPKAAAVVDPHRKDCGSSFKFLAGVGVAFKLIAAMEGGVYDDVWEQFGDIVAIGTVGDIVSLTGENRYLVRYGLPLISVTDNLGLSTLMQTAGISPEKVTSQTVAFGIVPRINAAGRMGDAADAVELLLSDGEERAQALAQKLNQLNQQRKDYESGILQQIEEQIENDPLSLYKRVLTFSKEGWHKGVIGIVSSKVLERYGKPNILLSETDGMLCGSARSVAGFSLFEALTACRDTLQKYGGHTQAAGMTLKKEDYPVFCEELEEYARVHFGVMPGYSYEIDKILNPEELNLENIRDLSILEPFGAGNEQPLFLLPKTVLRQVIPVSDNKHLRLKLDFGMVAVTAVLFNTSTEQFCYQPGEVLDLVCNISLNEYRGRDYLSVSVRDLRPSSFVEQNFFNGKAYYEMFRRGEHLTQKVREKMLPDRKETAVVFQYLQKHKGFLGDVDLLYPVFASKMNYCKFRLSIDALQDVGLLELSPLLNRISMLPWEEKVDLQQAQTIKRLRGEL